MIYILFILIFCLVLALNLIMHKQNNFFQQHGLKVAGRVVSMEDKTMSRKAGGLYTVKVPVIEYSYQGQMWRLEGDARAPDNHQIGEIVALVVHPKLPIAMTEKELEQRQLLSWIFKGVLLVPIGLCIGFYSMDQATSFMLFEPLGISYQHIDDLVATLVILTLMVKCYPIWKRWKKERDQTFMGLSYNVKLVS